MKKQKFLNTIYSIAAVLLFSLVFLACPPLDDDPGGKDPVEVDLVGKLLILQAYGSSETAAGVSHSFVELYNNTDKAIDLSGFTLQYAGGFSSHASWVPVPGVIKTQDSNWNAIDLKGSIPAKGSYLIASGLRQSTVARHKFPDKYGDLNPGSFSLSNRSFKVALVKGYKPLAVQNPFDIDGEGLKAEGLIDLVGALNTEDIDYINGYKSAPARCSASVAVRRDSLTDTNNNSVDFTSIRYAADAAGISKEELQVRKPRNSSAGAWDPFMTPEEPSPFKGLMIFQVYASGFEYVAGGYIDTPANTNRNTGAVSHTFIELYNNSDAPVDMTGFSVQWANGKANGGGTLISADEDWNIINLDGTVPAHSSYLIRGAQMNSLSGVVGRLQITACDKDLPAFVMSNRSFKIALVSNQVKLAMPDPWSNAPGSEGPKVPQLLDLIGARNGTNDSVAAYKGTMFESCSKQCSVRRKSLYDTGNNMYDFTRIDFRTEDLAKYQPRSLTSGAWTPGF